MFRCSGRPNSLNIGKILGLNKKMTYRNRRTSELNKDKEYSLDEEPEPVKKSL